MSVDAAIAVNRFGLGARGNELTDASAEPRAWLLAQVKQPMRYAALADLPNTSSGLKEFPKFVAKAGLLGNAAASAERSSMDGMADTAPAKSGKSVEQHYREHFGPILVREFAARLQVAADTPMPFQERLVWFWSNHFTVSTTKPGIAAVVGPYEREAIRPNVTGKFADLLVAAVKHPCMILYLDNNLSAADNYVDKPGFLARMLNAPRVTGLNENLAREIMELHTLGVGSGYTQADVTTFARVLTGWGVGGLFTSGFRFDAKKHDVGAKTILGKSYADTGQRQAEDVLRDLAAHPATALHIAAKLARHFISDDPPAAAVERIAKAFRDSGGDLQTVYAALVASPEAWAPVLAKARTPIEVVTASLRALPRGEGTKFDGAVGVLYTMGHAPLNAPSPKGWPDTAEAWLGADSVWKRIEWANTISSRYGNNIDALAVARRSYGALLSANTESALMRAESKQQALALWLASPEFQRR